MQGYGSFCPIAKASEILAERWTLLVLREVLAGSRRFNDFRRGIPHVSPTLLSRRLKTLEADGLIERRPSLRGNGWEYRPTTACEELGPILHSIGHWGHRWARSRLSPDELHPGELMWYILHHFAIDQLPQQRVTIYVEFSDVHKMKRWWFVLESRKVDLCLQDPGHPIDISIFTDLLTLTQIYLGEKSFSGAISSGKMTIDGPNSLTRHMWKWFGQSSFAQATRVA